MGLYRERIVPHLVNWACATPGMERWRERVCDGLHGDVVEIGFGSGLNVVHYPDTVRHVYAVEPSARSLRIGATRIENSPVPITHVGLDGQSIPLDASSCDSALMTFTLCTVADPEQVLGELRRVLVAGGSLHFLEHGIAPSAGVARWQRLLDPLEKRVADGCHLTRDAPALIRNAGFDITWLEQRYARGPKPWSYFSVGVAVSRD